MTRLKAGRPAFCQIDLRAGPATLAVAPPPPMPAPSLYERLGGRAGLLDLLKYFYADVRQHREIAPIFAAQIEDWPAHLEKIADFWSARQTTAAACR